MSVTMLNDVLQHVGKERKARQLKQKVKLYQKPTPAQQKMLQQRIEKEVSKENPQSIRDMSKRYNM